MTLGQVEVPPFPGIAMIDSTKLDWASFQARACSRPPFPTSRIRIGSWVDILSIVWGFSAIENRVEGESGVYRRREKGERKTSPHQTFFWGGLEGLFSPRLAG